MTTTSPGATRTFASLNSGRLNFGAPILEKGGEGVFSGAEPFERHNGETGFIQRRFELGERRLQECVLAIVNADPYRLAGLRIKSRLDRRDSDIGLGEALKRSQRADAIGQRGARSEIRQNNCE